LVKWDLHDVAFDDGGTATGEVTFDSPEDYPFNLDNPILCDVQTSGGLARPTRYTLGTADACFRAQHCCSWSEPQGALRALDGLDKSLSDAKPMAIAQYHKQWFFLEMARRNSASADWHARRAVSAAARLGAPFFNVAWMSQGAAALAMNGAYEEAGTWLDAAWSMSDNGYLKTYRPMILASKAYTALLQGRRAQGHELLRELFKLSTDAEAFSYIGTVPVLKDVVLAEALAAEISVPLVQSLIRKYAVAPVHPELPNWPWPVKVYTLGHSVSKSTETGFSTRARPLAKYCCC
jgi:hypothetical protein